MADWQKVLFDLSDTKIILYLDEKKGTRYSDLLANVVGNRSTLATSLRQLQDMALIDRRVKATRPIQTEYVLTDRGRKLVEHLRGIRGLLETGRTE